MAGDRRGFSIVEVLVAVVILTLGTLTLAGGSLFVTRDLVRSQQSTVAAGLAQMRMDDLRARAAATSPPCGSAQFTSSASPQTVQGVTLTWVVPTSGINRMVRVITTYQLAAGRTRTDTLFGSVPC